MNVKLISIDKIRRIIISKHRKNIFCNFCGRDNVEIIQQYNERECKVVQNNILYDCFINQKSDWYNNTIKMFSEVLVEFSSKCGQEYHLNPTWLNGKKTYCHCYINLYKSDINLNKFIYAKIYYLLSQCYMGEILEKNSTILYTGLSDEMPTKIHSNLESGSECNFEPNMNLNVSLSRNSDRNSDRNSNDNSKLEIMLVSYTDKINILITIYPDRIRDISGVNSDKEDKAIEILHSNTIYKKDSDDPQYEIVVLGLKELIRIKYQLDLKYDKSTGLFVSALNETHLDKDVYSSIVYEATNIYWTLKLGYSPQS